MSVFEDIDQIIDYAHFWNWAPDWNVVKEIYQKYQSFPTAMQGLGYKEVVEYLEGKISKDDMIEKIKQETRRYAKRQLTWFRKNKQTIWLDAQDKIQNNIKIILEG